MLRVARLSLFVVMCCHKDMPCGGLRRAFRTFVINLRRGKVSAIATTILLASAAVYLLLVRGLSSRGPKNSSFDGTRLTVVTVLSADGSFAALENLVGSLQVHAPHAQVYVFTADAAKSRASHWVNVHLRPLVWQSVHDERPDVSQAWAIQDALQQLPPSSSGAADFVLYLDPRVEVRDDLLADTLVSFATDGALHVNDIRTGGRGSLLCRCVSDRVTLSPMLGCACAECSDAVLGVLAGSEWHRRMAEQCSLGVLGAARCGGLEAHRTSTFSVAGPRQNLTVSPACLKQAVHAPLFVMRSKGTIDHLAASMTRTVVQRPLAFRTASSCANRRTSSWSTPLVNLS